jgi:hypothetical protein
MFKKSLATLLATTTLSGFGTLFVVSTLVVSNPFLTSPALAKATNYLKAIDFLYDNSHLNESMQVLSQIMARSGGQKIAQEIKGLLTNKIIGYGAGTFTITNIEVKLSSLKRSVKTPGKIPYLGFSSTGNHSLKFTLRGGYPTSRSSTVEVQFRSAHGLYLKSANDHIIIDHLSTYIQDGIVITPNLSAEEIKIVKKFFKESGEFSMLLNQSLISSPAAKQEFSGYIESAIGTYVPCNVYKIC